MANDTRVDVLTEQAEKLAERLLRDPLLALSYRNALADAVADTDIDGKLLDWFRDSGFSTDHAHLADVFAGAPSRLLAYWDGAYVIRVGDRLATLQIDDLGVLLDGVSCSGVAFADGILRFGASRTSPWNVELTFADLGWHGENPLASAQFFERSCTGRIWGENLRRPESKNAIGATKRVAYKGARSIPPHRLLTAATAAPLTIDADAWSAFVGQYGGDYEVHWTLKSGDTPKVRLLKISQDDQSGGVKVFFSDNSATTVLSTDAQHPSFDVLKFSDGKYDYALKFDSFGSIVKHFSGTIVLTGDQPPASDNAAGVLTKDKPLTWDLITGLVIGGLGLAVAILAPVITYILSKKDIDGVKEVLSELRRSALPEAVHLYSDNPDLKRGAIERLEQHYNGQARGFEYIRDVCLRRIDEVEAERVAAVEAQTALQADVERLERDAEAHEAELRQAREELQTQKAEAERLEKELEKEKDRHKSAEEHSSHSSDKEIEMRELHVV